MPILARVPGTQAAETRGYPEEQQRELLRTIAARYGTPVFVCFEEAIGRNLEALKAGFRPRPPVAICYSYKTNWLPGVCRIMHGHGLGAEVVSGFEVWLARQTGVPNEQIVFNGPGKTEEELREALSPPVGCLNIDSLPELERLLSIGPRLSDLRLGLRIGPGIEKSLWTFGVSHTEHDQIDRIVHRVLDSGLQLEVLHLHIGHRINSDGDFAGLCRIAASLAGSLRDRFGIRITRVDLGGGLHNDLAHPGRDGVTGLERMARTVDDLLCPGLDIAQVVLEPGRFLVDNAFVLLSSVLAIKETMGRKFAIMDAGTNILGAPHVSVGQLEVRPGEAVTYQLHGPLAFPGDLVAANVSLTALRENDLLCIANCGAYTLANSWQFIKCRPAVVLVTPSGDIRLMRRQETYEDMVALDRRQL